MNPVARSCALLILALGAGCGTSPEYFAVTSASGAMTVRPHQSSASGTRLDNSNPVVMADGATTRPGDISVDELKKKMTRAMAAQPLPPKRFLLYFVEGSDNLTSESISALEAILQEIRTRPSPDVAVIGHTDRVGTIAANDQLSNKRALAIQDRLRKLGIDADDIATSGRGEREPLIPTPDEVPEPRNRRVEILVR